MAMLGCVGGWAPSAISPGVPRNEGWVGHMTKPGSPKNSRPARWEAGCSVETRPEHGFQIPWGSRPMGASGCGGLLPSWPSFSET